MKTENNNRFLKMLKPEIRLIILFIFIISLAKSQNVSDGFDTVFVERDYSMPIIRSTAEKFLDTKKYMITDGNVFALVDVETINYTLNYEDFEFDMQTSKVTYNHLSEQALSPITELVYMVHAYIHHTFLLFGEGEIKYYINDTINQKTLEVTLEYLRHDKDFAKSPKNIQRAKDSVASDIARCIVQEYQQQKETK